MILSFSDREYLGSQGTLRPQGGHLKQILESCQFLSKPQAPIALNEQINNFFEG